MALHNGDGAVELLGQHHADEPMRQRHAAERKLKMRGLFERLAMPVRAADGEGHVERLVAQPGEHGGEFVRREHLPLLVERNKTRTPQLRQKRLSFLVFALLNRAAPALCDLDDRYRRYLQIACGRVEQIEIAVELGLLSAALEPPDGQNRNFHSGRPPSKSATLPRPAWVCRCPTSSRCCKRPAPPGGRHAQ